MSAVRKTLGEIATLCGGEIRSGDPSAVMAGVAPLPEAQPHQIAFYSNPSYRKHLSECRAGLVIAGHADAELPELAGRPVLVVAAPYAAFARVATAFNPTVRPPEGIDPSARVEAGAEVDPTARVEAFAFVARGARVGPRAVLMAGSYVGSGAVIGEDTVLSPHVVVKDGCLVGARCLLHPGVVIGADGFGFAFDAEGDGDGPIHRKIPQVGIARIEDDVEIGANSCVDRATLGETVVGRGTKIDNLVMIAHNVRLGPMCVIAAQTGIAGSTTVGTGVAMGGQTGIVGHIHIGDMARLGAQSGIMRDVPAGQTIAGHPGVEHKLWLRASAALMKVPDILKDLRQLARRLASLEARLEAPVRASSDSKGK